MLGLVLLNFATLSSSQSYYRDSSSGPIAGIDTNRYGYGEREGSYRIYGSLYDSRGRYDYYGRDDYRGGRCPYENVDERRSRYKREVIPVDLGDLNATSSRTTTGEDGPLITRLRRRRDVRVSTGSVSLADRTTTSRTSEGTSITGDSDSNDVSALFSDDRSAYYDRYYGRYDYGRYRYDDRYDTRYDDRYPYYNRYPYNDRPSYRDGCREECVWEAELTCDLTRFGRGAGYRRGYDYVRWEREVDSYYPRGKYRNILDYFGTRAEIDDRSTGASTLLIRKVRPEDKGVYRCYLEGGTERDFMEVRFYPKYPTTSRSIGC